MFKLIPLKMELLDSGQPTWEIMKLIIHAQYQITAIGIFAVIAISAIIIGVNWAILQRGVSKIKSEMTAKMTSLSEGIEKFKKDSGKEIHKLNGDTARIVSYIQADRGIYDSAVLWSGVGIEHFERAEEPDLRNMMIDRTIYRLKVCSNMKTNDKRTFLRCIDYIPAELDEKKEEIRELVNKLPEREVSKDEESEKEETQ